ncbi:MAG TPA: hypothetical protein VN032_05435 [Thermoanaerobaculia bacterium]|nr:hypothetical protein [Thermoanaerobaculia bacterium]
MTRVRAEASRIAEVRQAARAWHAAGAIDAPTLTSIEAAYPEERHRLAAAWKVLVFVIVSIAANAAAFPLVRFGGTAENAVSWLVIAAILAAVTEALLRSRRIGENGSAAATSFWAVVYAVMGSAFALLGAPERSSERAATLALLAAAVLFSAACWHWGFAAYGAFAAIAFFFLFARFPGGRLWWILAGVLLIAAAARQIERAALAPPLRRAWAGVLAVAAVALYAAFNRFCLDRRLIESVASPGSAAATAPSAVTLLVSSLATAALPLLFIAWGLHERRTLVLDLGVVLGALSLVTLRYYVHLAPLWVVLLAAGAVVILAALALNRRLRRAPGGEWAGFTARPLFSRRSVAGLQAAAVVAAFAPDAAPGPDRGGFTPGGGRFGGGGATGSF